MTQDRRNELAEQLECKAELVAEEYYGPDRDNPRWVADLEYAASCLRDDELHDLDQSAREELEACCVLSDEELTEIEQGVT